MKNKKVGVLMGGTSGEREVSLNSGKAVLEALMSKGYKAVAIDVGDDIVKRLLEESIDIAYISLHGRYGEDGTLQGLLELMKIPYTGSGVLASALSMNKVVSKEIFQFNKIPIPPYIVINKENKEDFSLKSLPFDLPVVVKPSCEGSSLGVNIVKSEDKFLEAVNLALSFGKEAIVEKYIKGREINVGILDNTALGAVEVIPEEEFYNYAAKYTAGTTRYLSPPPLPEEGYKKVLELGLKAHKSLKCQGGTRVDLIYCSVEEIYVLEVNSSPGMTKTSLLPKIAKSAGISFEDLVEKILKGASLKS